MLISEVQPTAGGTQTAADGHVEGQIQVQPIQMSVQKCGKGCMYLVGLQESHILSQLTVAAVLTVWYKVNEARALLTHWESFALHLIHPASRHKPYNLQITELLPHTACSPCRGSKHEWTGEVP